MSAGTEQRAPQDYGKVGVLMGGWSAEREVSLMSGEQVLKALLDAGVKAQAVDADRDLAGWLQKTAFDRFFNILHGRGGEDGEIQGVLEVSGIPYTGSGVLASALSMNKLKAKQVCSACGIDTPAWMVVASLQACRDAAESLGLPMVLKPVLEGSSIGISIVRKADQLESAFNAAAKYGPVFAEEFIDGVEVTAAILGRQALPLVSMSTDREFYDYHAKYFDDETRYLCPAGLPEDQEMQIRAIALNAFDALDAHGWGRVDFMIDKNGTARFIELNSVPGMTTHSLVPMAARQQGIDFKSLCLRILDSSFGERK